MVGVRGYKVEANMVFPASRVGGSLLDVPSAVTNADKENGPIQ
jgi:hypothetical protein